jgi:hypothetical protein
LRRDYKVPFKAEETIKASSLALRQRLGVSHLPDFSLRQCLERMACEDILLTGRIEIVLYTWSSGAPPAYVTFLPARTLHVDREVWEDASFNIPWARYILAHETGHLVLHNHYVQGFSGAQSKAWIDQESSEWQADRFADHLLVTDADVRSFCAPNAIVNHCAVTLELALRRLSPRFRYLDEYCPRCGHLKLYANDRCTSCDNCGYRAS